MIREEGCLPPFFENQHKIRKSAGGHGVLAVCAFYVHFKFSLPLLFPHRQASGLYGYSPPRNHSSLSSSRNTGRKLLRPSPYRRKTESHSPGTSPTASSFEHPPALLMYSIFTVYFRIYIILSKQTIIVNTRGWWLYAKICCSKAGKGSYFHAH